MEFVQQNNYWKLNISHMLGNLQGKYYIELVFLEFPLYLNKMFPVSMIVSLYISEHRDEEL